MLHGGSTECAILLLQRMSRSVSALAFCSGRIKCLCVLLCGAVSKCVCVKAKLGWVLVSVEGLKCVCGGAMVDVRAGMHGC